MLVNADVFIQTVVSYRLVWISGRFGGGKTSLAYRVAQEYLDQGYRLITNNKSVWSDNPNEIKLLPETNHLKSVIILDEGGLWFKSSKQIEMVASYAAKMDCIYLLPSFWPPTRSAQVLVVQPLFNFKSAGLPLIMYKWRVKIGSFQDQGYFGWWMPQEIYGIYSRQDPGDAGAEIVEWLIKRTNEFRDCYGRGADELSTLEISEQDILQDAVSEFASSVDAIAAIPIRKGRRR